MAAKALKLFHQCSPHTHSYIQLFPEYLSSRKSCLYYLTCATSYCTSNSQSSTKKEFVNISRNLSKDEVGLEKKASHILLKEKGFVPIYKLQVAPHFAVINRVKWQQLYLYTGSTPLSFLCAGLNLCSTSVPIAVFVVGGVITSSLWIFAAIFKRVVGAILVSPDGETVCISYVDNKGQRQDDVFPTNDLVPLSDLPYLKYTSSWWIPLRRYSTSEEEYESYKMFVQNYDIPDKQRFMEVFGSLL